MEQVRVCRFCGQVSPQPHAARCAKCGSFSGLTDLSQVEAAQVTRRHWLRFLRRRSIRWGLVATLLVVLLVWTLRTFFDVGPVPPGATTTLTADLSPQTWAQSRRTLQNAGYTSDQAPVPQVEKWVASSSGSIIAAPAVVGGLVYFIGEDGLARALDTHTGQVVWDYPTGVPSSSAPAVAGDLVFFTLRPGRILAFNKSTGALVWEKVFDDPILASPIIADGSLYIGVSDRRLYAVDAATGQERWTFASNDWIPSEIAYEDGAVALSSLGGLVHVINAKTGRQRLQYKTGRGRSSAGGPVIQGGHDLFRFLRRPPLGRRPPRVEPSLGPVLPLLEDQLLHLGMVRVSRHSTGHRLGRRPGRERHPHSRRGPWTGLRGQRRGQGAGRLMLPPAANAGQPSWRAKSPPLPRLPAIPCSSALKKARSSASTLSPAPSSGISRPAPRLPPFPSWWATPSTSPTTMATFMP